MSISQWSTTAASNASGVTGITWAEGQAPSTVNDSSREMMAQIATWLGQASGAIPEYLTGVAGTNTITATGPAQMAGYVAGQRFAFIPANTNTGATTLNITPSGASALGAKNVFCNGSACIGGEFQVGVPAVVVYDGTQFQITGSGAAAVRTSVNTTTVGNVGGGTDDLMSFTLPANYLSANGKTIRITAFGRTANNANAKTLTLAFGTATVGFTMTTGALHTWEYRALITRTGSNAQQLSATLLESSTILSTTLIAVNTPVSATETDNATITIKFTAAATADNDITQNYMLVELLN